MIRNFGEVKMQAIVGAIAVLPLVFAVGAVMAGCAGPKKYELSDHYDGDRFTNLNKDVQVDKSFASVLKWQLGNNRTNKPWPETVTANVPPSLPETLLHDEAAITYVGHATLLVQFNGLNVLTDPVYSQLASPFQWMGPKRVAQPGIDFDSLPRIDVVAVSHNHYDHLDLATLKRLNDKHHPKFIVPLANATYLESEGIENVIEIDWWQAVELNSEQSITLVPAQHWSARGMFDKRKALWGGFVFRSKDLSVFFAGDTGYASHFTMIREKLGAPDASLLPIGAYEPRWFMKEAHMNPSDAIQAHRDLGSKQSIAIHFGTFNLTDEGIDDPVNDLATGLSEAKVHPESFIAPKNGQTIRIKKSIAP